MAEEVWKKLVEMFGESNARRIVGGGKGAAVGALSAYGISAGTGWDFTQLLIAAGLAAAAAGVIAAGGVTTTNTPP